MKCPFCLQHFSPTRDTWYFKSKNEPWHDPSEESEAITAYQCPACGEYQLHLMVLSADLEGEYINSDKLIYPIELNRDPPPPNVPGDIAQDFKEACAVLALSPRASAALSRRCLQHLLRSQYPAMPRQTLDKEVQYVLSLGVLPPYVRDIDAIRNIGNLASHPIEDITSYEILSVEPEEAEWSLELLEALFKFYYAEPQKQLDRRTILDSKLARAGKPPLKA